MDPVLEIVCPYPDCQDCCSVVPFEPHGYSDGQSVIAMECRVCKRPIRVEIQIRRAIPQP